MLGLMAWWTFLRAVLCEASLALLSVWLSPPYFPKSYAESPHRAKLWHTTFAAIFPAVVAPALAAPGLVQLLSERWSPKNLLLMPANELLWCALGVSVAHFYFDLSIMLFYSRDFVRAMGRPLYKQMIFHHAASALAWPYALIRGKCVCFVAYFIITEVSNIFLNVRWFFAEKDSSSALRAVIELAFFVTFTLVRILPIALAIYVVMHADWFHYIQLSNWLDLCLTTLAIVPFGLNLFWYSIILRSAHQKLCKR